MNTQFFFQQERVGFLADANSVSCFGMATNPINDHLVAIAVQGGTTMIEQLHAQISSDNYTRIGVQLGDDRWSPKKYASASGKYRAIKSTIPNSTKRNMVVLHSSFYYTPDDIRSSTARNDNYIYRPLFEEDSIMLEVAWETVMSIVKIGIKREWMKTIISNASTTMHRHERSCGYVRRRENDSDRIWNSAGFNFFWIENNESKWTRIVKKALENKEIKIG